MAHMQRDVILLFAARSVRMFAYGALSVVLALYLHEAGLNGEEVGLLFTLTLVGDAGISLWITTVADRIGRKQMLILGALLMCFAGIVFSITGNITLLTIAAVFGVISPSGNEIGPFLSLEQAGLAQILPAEERTTVFAKYSLAGSRATAIGALAAGFLSRTLTGAGLSALASYRTVIQAYAACGIILVVIFLFLSTNVEAQASVLARGRVLGLHKSRGVVLKLSGLFALDAFAGGFVIQSMLAYWFHIKFDLDAGTLGVIFFAAHVLAGFSLVIAANIANRIGLIRTMVFTHIPSNVLLCLVPLMPNVALAVTVLLMRFSISQMDVPTRQSYTMAVVDPDERSAASGVTTIARSVGGAISPVLAGAFLAAPAYLGVPFFLAGGLKTAYDLLLYRSFRQIELK